MYKISRIMPVIGGTGEVVLCLRTLGSQATSQERGSGLSGIASANLSFWSRWPPVPAPSVLNRCGWGHGARLCLRCSSLPHPHTLLETSEHGPPAATGDEWSGQGQSMCSEQLKWVYTFLMSGAELNSMRLVLQQYVQGMLL